MASIQPLLVTPRCLFPYLTISKLLESSVFWRLGEEVVFDSDSGSKSDRDESCNDSAQQQQTESEKQAQTQQAAAAARNG
eukprot:2695956-Pleurochrysis_carterae.AAC.1